MCFFFLIRRRPPRSTRTDPLFPYTTLFRSPVLSQLNLVQYAMDDFGDDYSSMQRLIRYPWDYCKFDANKIINLHDFGAVLYCVHNQIEIVAERVENKTLAESVKSLGLILQQGFFHERPKPPFALQPSSYAPPENRDRKSDEEGKRGRERVNHYGG